MRYSGRHSKRGINRIVQSEMKESDSISAKHTNMKLVCMPPESCKDPRYITSHPRRLPSGDTVKTTMPRAATGQEAVEIYIAKQHRRVAVHKHASVVFGRLRRDSKKAKSNCKSAGRKKKECPRKVDSSPKVFSSPQKHKIRCGCGLHAL